MRRQEVASSTGLLRWFLNSFILSRSRNKRSPKTGVRATPAPLFSGILSIDFREALILVYAEIHYCSKQKPDNCETTACSILRYIPYTAAWTHVPLQPRAR